MKISFLGTVPILVFGRYQTHGVEITGGITKLNIAAGQSVFIKSTIRRCEHWDRYASRAEFKISSFESGRNRVYISGKRLRRPILVKYAVKISDFALFSVEEP